MEIESEHRSFALLLVLNVYTRVNSVTFRKAYLISFNTKGVDS